KTASLVALLLLTGCAVGPNYARPRVDVPGGYRGLAPDIPPQTAGVTLGNEKWWDVFQDPTLRDLITTALKENYDARIAAERILEARAQLGITRADQFPTVTAGASAVNERTPVSIGRPPVETSGLALSASLVWEFDFWGKFRRSTESA